MKGSCEMVKAKKPRGRPSQPVTREILMNMRLHDMEKETMDNASFCKATSAAIREIALLSAESSTAISEGKMTVDEAAEKYRNLLAGLVQKSDGDKT